MFVTVNTALTAARSWQSTGVGGDNRQPQCGSHVAPSVPHCPSRVGPPLPPAGLPPAIPTSPRPAPSRQTRHRMGARVCSDDMGVYGDDMGVYGDDMGVCGDGTRVCGDGTGVYDDGMRVYGDGMGECGDGMRRLAAPAQLITARRLLK
eukprot:3333891-Pyramimonas_sp.AAC.1